jgi:hypothetical protein
LAPDGPGRGADRRAPGCRLNRAVG